MNDLYVPEELCSTCPHPRWMHQVPPGSCLWARLGLSVAWKPALNPCPCQRFTRTETEDEMTTSDRTSLHETIFWEIRSGPAKDDREMADWVIDLVREAVLSLDVITVGLMQNTVVRLDEVLALLVKPHPAEPRPEDPMVEAYSDLLCALLGHEHTGRPRCVAYDAAERLLAVHERLEHPLIEVPVEVVAEIPPGPPAPYYSVACGAPRVIGSGSATVNRVYCTRKPGHEGKHCSGPYCEWDQTDEVACRARIESRPGEWIECQEPLGHEGAHLDYTGTLHYQWIDDQMVGGPPCPAHVDHHYCRRTEGHIGYHVDMQGNVFTALSDETVFKR